MYKEEEFHHYEVKQVYDSPYQNYRVEDLRRQVWPINQQIPYFDNSFEMSIENRKCIGHQYKKYVAFSCLQLSCICTSQM